MNLNEALQFINRLGYKIKKPERIGFIHGLCVASNDAGRNRNHGCNESSAIQTKESESRRYLRSDSRFLRRRLGKEK